MANQFSGDAGFEWNPKQPRETATSLNPLPDTDQAVWRLRYHTGKKVNTTYHHTVGGAKRMVAMCVKSNFDVQSLCRIKVESMPVTLAEMIADARVPDLDFGAGAYGDEYGPDETGDY